MLSFIIDLIALIIDCSDCGVVFVLVGFDDQLQDNIDEIQLCLKIAYTLLSYCIITMPLY